MQIIEGEKEVVLDLFDKIKRDARHTLVSVFYQGEIAERSFPDWSMEYLIVDNHQMRQLMRTSFNQSSTPITDFCKESPSRGKKTFLSLRESLYDKLI